MMVLIKLVFVSTSTFFVGDLADILVGFALVIPWASSITASAPSRARFSEWA